MTPEQKKYQRLVKRIEKSNQEFQKASKSQRIVMVAKDVLAMLKLGKMQATSGTYFEVPGIPNSPLVEKKGSCQLSDILKMPDLPTCEVCAIGGAMMASVLRLKKVDVDCGDIADGILGVYLSEKDRNNPGFSNPNNHYYVVGRKMALKTEQVFPPKLLHEMEEAFENGSYGYDIGSDRQNMQDIYQNLIDNKGKKFTMRDDPKTVVWEA